MSGLGLSVLVWGLGSVCCVIMGRKCRDGQLFKRGGASTEPKRFGFGAQATLNRFRQGFGRFEKLSMDTRSYPGGLENGFGKVRG